MGVYMVNFSEIKNLIKTKSEYSDFVRAGKELEEIIFSLNKNDLISIITKIGIIPENIEHNSSEEKLYAKTADMVLAKCFQELGLKASVINQRANCADVSAKSLYHKYSLVADAKTFRLSRTAKNQKDFKVKSMVDWREDNDYAVLACPYFQYPKNNSQIYGQALSGNVLLFSWEYFSILLQNNIIETKEYSLEKIWNISHLIAENTSISSQNNNYIEEQNKLLCKIVGLKMQSCLNNFSVFKTEIITRGEQEIIFGKNKISEIETYSKAKAIKELISSLKLHEKINVIKRYIASLR